MSTAAVTRRNMFSSLFVYKQPGWCYLLPASWEVTSSKRSHSLDTCSFEYGCILLSHHLAFLISAPPKKWSRDWQCLKPVMIGILQHSNGTKMCNKTLIECLLVDSSMWLMTSVGINGHVWRFFVQRGWM